MTSDTGGTPQSAAETPDQVWSGALAGHWQLDPAASRIEFRVRHFWHAITVRGWFDRIEGEGTVEPDGSVTGRLSIDAASLTTKNKKRDVHLRSADFFDVEHHPTVVVAVSQITPAAGASITPEAGGRLTGDGTLTAAGITRPISFTGEVLASGADEVTLRAEVVVDRTQFGMTWSPLRVAASEAAATVTARFTRTSE